MSRNQILWGIEYRDKKLKRRNVGIVVNVPFFEHCHYIILPHFYIIHLCSITHLPVHSFFNNSDIIN